MKRAICFLVLVCLGCSAQSRTPSAEDSARLKRMIRADFNVASSVEITLGATKPSEFNGYDTLPVTLSNAERSKSFEFLVSKDWHKVLRMEPLDDVEEQINLTGRPSRGPGDARVLIITYDDFECPYCAVNHAELFDDIMKEYGDKVRVVYKDYPLFEIHPWAGRAAVDSGCLAKQSNQAYWEFADYVHKNQKQFTGKERALADQFAAVDKFTAEVGERQKLDTAKLQACLAKQDDTELKNSVKEADSLGVSATPTMYINGVRVNGAVPPEQFRARLDSALRDAGETPPAHAPAAQPAPAGGADAKKP